MAQMQAGKPIVPIWLRALGVLAVGAIGAGMLYAMVIGIANFSRISV